MLVPDVLGPGVPGDAGRCLGGGAMNRPTALDLFCGVGGASAGLHRAGFDVTGIDHARQSRYPFRFIQADALNPPVRLTDFDFIWASPPCQSHTSMRGMWNGREKRGLEPHADLIPQTRAMLIASGCPYVIENVPGAPLRVTIQLCGTMFGLGTSNGAELQRHRWFEASFMMLQPTCRHRSFTVGIHGEGARDATHDRRRVITITGRTPQQNVVKNVVRRVYTADDARTAMGMPWATMAGLSQAIPPAYSEYIGLAAMELLSVKEES